MAIKFANVLLLIIKNLELFYKSLECFESHTAKIHRNPPRYRHPSKLPTGTICISLPLLFLLKTLSGASPNKYSPVGYDACIGRTIIV